MRFFGLDIRRTKAIPQINSTGQLVSVESTRGWWPIVRESFAGAWQMNVDVSVANVATHPAVFACVTLIANDISKMRLRLVQQDADGIWHETASPAFSPVLRRPNHFQNQIQFIQSWVLSKLLNGNTYVLKIRDERRVVIGLYVLDPANVEPLIAPNSEVFYRLKTESLSQLPEASYVVPSSEIIHDRHNCLFHPLVGLSPIFACGLAAVQGLNILNNSANFFGNGSNPGGVILVPGAIKPESAERVKVKWETEFGGDNAGKVALLADGMKYEQLKMSAVDSQLIEQLKWTAEVICSVFHVPAYMVGFGPPPSYANIEALIKQYYSQCLQNPTVSIEVLLDHGLGLTEGESAAKRYGTEFDRDDLWLMDSATMMSTIKDGVNAGIMKPNEGRIKMNLAPVPGGDTPYLQQQYWPLQQLAGREIPAVPATPSAQVQPNTSESDEEETSQKALPIVDLDAFRWKVQEATELALKQWKRAA